MAKKFPNGFVSWMETHFEVVEFITVENQKDNKSKFKGLIRLRQDTGTGGMYELSRELTDKFEKKNKGREWDGEFFDEVADFIAEELQKL